MLIRIDRSSFAFANQLKSEKFSENLTDVRTDFQPIEKTRKESDRSYSNTEFLTKKTPKTIHFEILRLLSK